MKPCRLSRDSVGIKGRRERELERKKDGDGEGDGEGDEGEKMKVFGSNPTREEGKTKCSQKIGDIKVSKLFEVFVSMSKAIDMGLSIEDGLPERENQPKVILNSRGDIHNHGDDDEKDAEGEDCDIID
ncbi:Hypothetical predicted protein [Octopus vulgaris]|uniref:Uncharacterized protein n=1 Tax=Octopus vulgaris TaxID=6645 RepID=A0AA36FIV4_OCTVU|nr:Hypothetical predicted protein [Octopus vulgaris]